MTIQEHQDYLLSLKGKDLKNELLNAIQNSSMPLYDKAVAKLLIEEFGQQEYERGYENCELNMNDN